MKPLISGIKAFTEPNLRNIKQNTHPEVVQLSPSGATIALHLTSRIKDHTSASVAKLLLEFSLASFGEHGNFSARQRVAGLIVDTSAPNASLGGAGLS
jgi:hypothetical protein